MEGKENLNIQKDVVGGKIIENGTECQRSRKMCVEKVNEKKYENEENEKEKVTNKNS